VAMKPLKSYNNAPLCTKFVVCLFFAINAILGHACCRNRDVIKHSRMGNSRDDPSPGVCRKATCGTGQSSGKGESCKRDGHTQSAILERGGEGDAALVPTSPSQYSAQIPAGHNRGRIRSTGQHAADNQHLRHPARP